MTEVVDKTLIERLILEQSDRLELEINQKARADAWKFYYRVRIDHVVRPFAVCKVCYRVLHCDSRSGTASLLRHPCNPLSERSPVNRAVKLSAKLNLPTDSIIKNDVFKEDKLKSNLSSQIDVLNNLSNLRHSPVPLIGRGNPPTSNCSSPTSGSSDSPPISGNSLTLPSYCINGGKKRKAGVTSPAFPLDLRLLQIPHMMAAVAAHPLAALNFANATALLSDPQQFHHIQQQQSHLETILREHQLQQERELKRNREDEKVVSCDRNGSSPGETSGSNFTWAKPRVKKEKSESNEELRVGSFENDIKTSSHFGRGRQNNDEGTDSRSAGTWMNKEMVQHLVNISSDRVRLSEKNSGGSHYISDVWSRFQVVYVDEILRPFASCKNCHKVVTYTKYSGTGGLLRHRCSSQDLRHKSSPARDIPIVDDSLSDLQHESPGSGNLDLSFKSGGSLFSTTQKFSVKPVELMHSFTLANGVGSNHTNNTSPNNIPNSTMAEVARALLRYMCHDLISASTIDTPAFHHLVWTVLNIGPTIGSFRHEESFPSSQQLLSSILPPIVLDSKEIISRDLQSQNYLCFSLFSRKVGEEIILTASVHCITQDFQLQNHALGTRRFYKDETLDEVLHSLLRDFFQDSWSPATLQEKYLTVVTDEGDAGILGSTGIKCVWHSVESVLENLTDVVEYSKICDEVRSILAFLADSGMHNIASYNLSSNEVHRWEALLHAIAFLLSHYDEVKSLLSNSQSSINNVPEISLSGHEIYEEVRDLLMGVRRCLMTVRDFKRPTLNQAVLCRAKLLQLCSSTPSNSTVVEQVKEYLCNKLESALSLDPLHLVASFLDPRCKSLKVLTETEKGDVHRLVLEMMKAVSVTEANSGVLNLKTTRRSPSYSSDTASKREVPDDESAPETHPFLEYMDNPGSDLSISDSEEIMAYVNMKVHLDNDDILGWWSGSSAAGLPTLRRLARKVLAVPATCAFACQMDAHAVAASEKMGIAEPSQVNNILHVRYNMI